MFPVNAVCSDGVCQRVTNLNRCSTPSALCTSPRPPYTLAPDILLTTLEPRPTYGTYSR